MQFKTQNTVWILHNVSSKQNTYQNIRPYEKLNLQTRQVTKAQTIVCFCWFFFTQEVVDLQHFSNVFLLF